MHERARRARTRAPLPAGLPGTGRPASRAARAGLTAAPAPARSRRAGATSAPRASRAPRRTTAAPDARRLARWMKTCATSCASTSSRPPSGYEGVRSARRTTTFEIPSVYPATQAGTLRASGEDSGARTTWMSGPGASRPTSSITLATHGCGPSTRRFADGRSPGCGSMTRRVGSATASGAARRTAARTRRVRMTARVLRRSPASPASALERDAEARALLFRRR